MVTIAFDAKRMLCNATGLGNYSRTLVNDLQRILPRQWDMLFFAPDEGRKELRGVMEVSTRTFYRYPLKAHNKLTKSIWRSWGIVNDLKCNNVDLYHGLSGELPLNLKASGIPGIVTIHDLIFLRHPEYYNPIDVAIYKAKFHLTCRQADRIIAISKRTALDIMELGGVDKERIDVIYQSCEPRFTTVIPPDTVEKVRTFYNLPQRFMLCVGSIEERKNAMLALKALPFLPDDMHLVLVGKHTKYTDKLLSYAKKHSLTQRLHILHGIDNSTLQAIYHMAEVFVYPSRYEGFGIPIIEAIQSRLPVVACTGSCLEEAGGPHCLYVDPDDAMAMAEAVKQMMRGAANRETRIEKSLQYVQQFENTNSAQQVAEVYMRCLKEHGKSL